ncbi:MAG: protein kinase [Planctomycetes bacterium]|nr:protein kinase [Planctomycetota bacterium]
MKARAQHYLGLALGKLRKGAEACAALLDAREFYRLAGDPAGRAQATDTLGSLYAAEGRLDRAATLYALSLVEKLSHGDRYGMALSLGNLGRAQLRAGRPREALECFEQSRRIAVGEGLGDERGRLRLLEDEARARLELGDPAEARSAEALLHEVVDGARRAGYRDLEFFAWKDLALAALAARRWDDAAKALEAARSARPLGGEEYHELLLLHVQALLELGRGDDVALERLAQVARGFRRAALPDLEISVRAALARALRERERCSEAAAVLEEAIGLARGDGFERLRVRLVELFTELELHRGMPEEQGRLVVAGKKTSALGYDLLQPVGKGAFGEVWKAFDPERLQVVALKRLKLAQLYEEEERARLVDSAKLELAATRSLFHPGIARVHAVGRDDEGELYIVQDFVPGLPLAALLETREPAEPGLALPILVDIARALDAIHGAATRVIHRDLKPANVILVQRERLRPVLVDFGLACLPDDPARMERLLRAGTPHYAAPEQLSGKHLNEAVDLYALGVIAYEWLAGCLPFEWPERESLESFCDRVQRERPIPLAKRRPDLDPELCAVIDRLLSKVARNRGRSAADVADALERWARS